MTAPIVCVTCKLPQFLPFCLARQRDCTLSLPLQEEVPSTLPPIDAPREFADSDLHREVIEEFISLEPSRPVEDDFVALPLRIVHDLSEGYRLELGPYDLSNMDVGKLLLAIQRLAELKGIQR